jgi:hypothetical protein
MPRVRSSTVLFDRDEAAGKGTSRCFDERKNNKRKGGDYVAAVECKPGKVPEDDSTRFFDDLLEKPCLNHAYPFKHLLKNCGLAKRWFGSSAGRGEQKKKPELEDTTEKEKQNDVPKTDGCLMIFGGPLACESKRKQKIMRREVFAAETATSTYLRWSDAAIKSIVTTTRTTSPSQGDARWLWTQLLAPSAARGS